MKIFGFTTLFMIPMLANLGRIFSATETDMVLSLAEIFKISYCVIGGKKEREDIQVGWTKESSSRRKLLTTWLGFDEILNFSNDYIRSSKSGGRTMIILKMNADTLAFLRKLSAVENLSFAVWVMFSEDSLDPRMLENVYIPFDCEFVFVRQNDSFFTVTELYNVKKTSNLETYDLGYWTEENGLSLAEPFFFARRNSLKGHIFKAVIKNNPPYVSILQKNEEENSTFVGYLYEIWKELELRIDFGTEFSDEYFHRDPVDVLKNEDVDFAVARISNEPSQFQDIHFSLPVDISKYFMFGHRPGSELEWNSYLKPFSSETWLVNLGWMLSSSVALAVLYKAAWNLGTSEREAKYFVFTFSESVLTVLRAICMQGSDVTPRSNSCRLMFLSIYLTALVVTSAFSAALFSLLTIPKPRSPFNTLEEVLKSRRFKLGFPSDSDFVKLIEDFSNSLRGSKEKQLLKKLIESKEGLSSTAAEGLERLCRDKSYVFTFDLPSVLYLMQNMTRACQDKILPSGPALFKEFISFGFKRNSPYRKIINFHLVRMKNEGILHRLLINHWPPQIPTVQATWVRVTVSDISPILYMFALGTLLGTVLLYAEKIFLRFCKKRSDPGSFVSEDNAVIVRKKLILTNYSQMDNILPEK